MRTLVTIVLVSTLCAPCLGQTQAQPSLEAPMQFYVRYRAAVEKALSVDQIVAFWSDGQAKAFKAAPPDERMSLDELKKAYARLTRVGIVRELVKADSATLILEAVSGDGKPITGSAQLVKENGSWKLAAPERWGN